MLGLGPLRLGQMSLASGILTNRKALGDEIPVHSIGNLEEIAKLVAFFGFG